MTNKYDPNANKAYKVLRCDPKTQEWIHKNPDAPVTLVLCKKCGIHYAPDLGHECKNVR